MTTQGQHNEKKATPERPHTAGSCSYEGGEHVQSMCGDRNQRRPTGRRGALTRRVSQRLLGDGAVLCLGPGGGYMCVIISNSH